jgi:membrane-bound serine protease (ClpP class)
MSNLTKRLIVAIISTIIEEIVIFIAARLGLPEIGINLPLPVVIVIMVLWLGYSIFVFRMGTRALKKEPVKSLINMIGSKGEVASLLAPEGMVRIKGELWIAESSSGELEPGGQVIVIGQDRLKLIVSRYDPTDQNPPQDTG